MPNETAIPLDPGRLIYGLKAIGSRIGLTERQARHLHDKGDLPTRKKGKRVCATEGALVEWLRQLQGSDSND
ncbi:hypothetical protein ABNQ39_07025 [Azospirillum sp. A26]|uniref:hypothetical protein n=1 Tax=Azospirillum sp. A26 TaxID=3160607 RepID=UPI003673253D